jgi:hypothetical protein
MHRSWCLPVVHFVVRDRSPTIAGPALATTPSHRDVAMAEAVSIGLSGGCLLSCSLSRSGARFTSRQQPEQMSLQLVPKAGGRT